MEHTWIDTLVTWGAYVISGAAIFLARLIQGKFTVQDANVDKVHDRVDIVEKQLIEHQLDASRRYVDKVEYLNTLNRMYDKLDSIDKSINTLNSTMGGYK